MKKLWILVAFLIGILSANASDSEEEAVAAGTAVHYDFVTQYLVIKASEPNPEEFYEIRDQSNSLVSSFSLERTEAEKVLIKEFEPATGESFFSIFTILGYLQAQEYAIFGPSSAVFWKGSADDNETLAEYGFELSTDPTILANFPTHDAERIYIRSKQITVARDKKKSKRGKEVTI